MLQSFRPTIFFSIKSWNKTIGNDKQQWPTIIETLKLSFILKEKEERKLLFDDFFTIWYQKQSLDWSFDSVKTQTKCKMSKKSFIRHYCWCLYVFPIQLAFSLSFQLMELLSVFNSGENGTFSFCQRNSKYWLVYPRPENGKQNVTSLFFPSHFFILKMKKENKRVSFYNTFDAFWDSYCFLRCGFFFCSLFELPWWLHWSIITANSHTFSYFCHDIVDGKMPYY